MMLLICKTNIIWYIIDLIQYIDLILFYDLDCSFVLCTGLIDLWFWVFDYKTKREWKILDDEGCEPNSFYIEVSWRKGYCGVLWIQVP